jgi:hypothetical protein
MVLLVLAAVSSILAAVTLSSAQPGAKAAFTGVWETVAGSATRYSVELTQIGNKVTGTYTPGNGEIFGGVVLGDKVTFKWTQDGGYSGTGEFTLNADRKGFTGSSTTVKPSPATHPWSTFDPGPPRSFAGTWDLVNNNGVRIPVTIVQNGSKATGLYPAQNGKLEGTVEGRILRFKWESSKGSGNGEFNISNSGQTFGVTFKKGNGTAIAESGSWGERPAAPDSSAPPKPSLPAASGPVSFTGCWRLSGGLISGQTICLKQDEGGRVTDGDRFEGTISGNTLRFTAGDSSSGRLTIDKGGKSFQGFWHAGNDTGSEEDPCTGVTTHKPLGKILNPTFTGSWLITDGGAQGGMDIKQSGSVVTGFYGTNQGSYELKDGHVNGNTLRFVLLVRIARTTITAPRIGELVLDPSGKSFRGNIGGVPVTGTLKNS